MPKPSLAPSRVNRRAAARLPSEAQVQDSIVELARDRLGYTVMEIGRWRKQVMCPCGCGHWFTPHTGMPNTPDAPDLFLTHPRFVTKRPWWLGIECKAPGGRSLFGAIQPGRIRPGQQALADAGMVAIAHSLEEALEVLGEEDRLR